MLRVRAAAGKVSPYKWATRVIIRIRTRPFRNILNSGSLLLAMSFGKCIVAPAVGSIKEIACEKGWVPYTTNSKDGLSKALEQGLTMDDLDQREQFVSKFTVENYDWSLTGKRVIQLYSNILHS